MCGRFTLKTPVGNWLANLFPKIQSPRVSRSKREPIQRLVILSYDGLRYLGRLYAHRLQEVAPMLEDASADVVIRPSKVSDKLSPSGRERVELRLRLLRVFPQISVEVLDANVDEDVHPLELSQFPNDLERKGAQAVRI